MGDEKQAPGDLVDGGPEEIEIEFIDEVTPTDSGLEPVADVADVIDDVVDDEVEGDDAPLDLGPSIEVEIERLESELDELRDIHLRKLAEFDNFRKRTDRERNEVKRMASEELVRELLPVLDNFERALQHGPDADPDAFHEGVVMIAKQLWDTLERQGVKVVDPIGEAFSPELHEAVHQVKDDSMEPGLVASVLAKGYLFKGRLIRPAMVGVVSEQNNETDLTDEEGIDVVAAGEHDE